MKPIGEKLNCDWRCGLKRDGNLPRYRPLRGDCLGGVKPQNAWYIGCIVLPATPSDGITMPHQKAVAGMFWARRRIAVRRVIKKLHESFVATIDDVIDQPLIASRQVNGFEERKRRFVFDVAGGVARGMKKIDHALINGRLGVDGKPDAAAQALIRTDLCKIDPFGKRFARFNV